jgi:hypothetical protein
MSTIFKPFKVFRFEPNIELHADWKLVASFDKREDADIYKDAAERETKQQHMVRQYRSQ